MLRALLTLPLLLLLALLVSLLVFPGKVGEIFSSNSAPQAQNANPPPVAVQPPPQQAPAPMVQQHGPKSNRPPTGNKK